MANFAVGNMITMPYSPEKSAATQQIFRPNRNNISQPLIWLNLAEFTLPKYLLSEQTKTNRMSGMKCQRVNCRVVKYAHTSYFFTWSRYHAIALKHNREILEISYDFHKRDLKLEPEWRRWSLKLEFTIRILYYYIFIYKSEGTPDRHLHWENLSHWTTSQPLYW